MEVIEEILDDITRHFTGGLAVVLWWVEIEGIVLPIGWAPRGVDKNKAAWMPDWAELVYVVHSMSRSYIEASHAVMNRCIQVPMHQLDLMALLNCDPFCSLARNLGSPRQQWPALRKILSRANHLNTKHSTTWHYKLSDDSCLISQSIILRHTLIHNFSNSQLWQHFIILRLFSHR